MVLHGFLALRYFFAVVLISMEAQAQFGGVNPLDPKTLLKAGISELANPGRIPRYLIVNHKNVSQNKKFWDALLALADLLDSMPNGSNARNEIMMAACDWVKASTTNATEQFDCRQSSSWSAVGAIIRVIKDTGTINEELKSPKSVSWEQLVQNSTRDEPNDLVNNILNLLVQ